MNTPSINLCLVRGGLWSVLAATCSMAELHSQNPVLAPANDTTVTVAAFPIRYASISIPIGVKVRFVAPGFGSMAAPGIPAVVFCDGDALIHGEITLAGDTAGWTPPNTRPAGWVTTGAGTYGTVCGSAWVYAIGRGGGHAGLYGSVIPFSLEGGSPGGDMDVYAAGCMPYLYTRNGGIGGGTLVLHAGGRIEVSGRVTADGLYVATGGSGGSILLRGDAGVLIHPTGSVTARGGTTTYPVSPLTSVHPLTLGAPGYVRIDAWGAPPVILGTVDPAPTTLELPWLRTQSPPQTGSTWILDVLAPENSPVFLSGSLQAGPGTPTPFGTLGIHLPTATGIALTVAQPGHDPIASVPLPVPPAPVLVGLGLWVQAFVVPPSLPPRLSNTVAAVVQ